MRANVSHYHAAGRLTDRIKAANLCWRNRRTSLHRETFTRTNPITKINAPTPPTVSAENAALVNAVTKPKQAQIIETWLNPDSVTSLYPVAQNGQTRRRARRNNPKPARSMMTAKRIASIR
jgi:hypothetical protein